VAGIEDYCRQIEAYLCRKNDGHLIRIVGPAFEQVCGWATRGVPLTIAQRGIDRYFERYYAKGQRRRPVRIEFCEADVLDVFDEWRRALGITVGAMPASPSPASDVSPEHASDASPVHDRRHQSLPAHLERVVARLTALRAGEDRALDSTLDEIVREIDVARAGARGLRGEARRALIDRLRVLDDHLLDAARAQCDAQTMAALVEEADGDLAPFRGRMAPEAHEQSRRAAVDRLLRERRKLPIVAFE
jgi:hypothetical protein